MNLLLGVIGGLNLHLTCGEAFTLQTKGLPHWSRRKQFEGRVNRYDETSYKVGQPKSRFRKSHQDKRAVDPGDGPDRLAEMVQQFMGGDDSELEFLLDLRGVTYISSTGVGSLIKNYRSVLKQKGHFKLLSPSQSVMNILAISKLDGVFEIFTDETTALSSFAPKPA